MNGTLQNDNASPIPALNRLTDHSKSDLSRCLKEDLSNSKHPINQRNQPQGKGATLGKMGDICDQEEKSFVFGESTTIIGSGIDSNLKGSAGASSGKD